MSTEKLAYTLPPYSDATGFLYYFAFQTQRKQRHNVVTSFYFLLVQNTAHKQNINTISNSEFLLHLLQILQNYVFCTQISYDQALYINKHQPPTPDHKPKTALFPKNLCLESHAGDVVMKRDFFNKQFLYFYCRSSQQKING